MKRIIPIIILLAALAAAYWWFNQPRVEALAPAGLVGSGSIEAEKITITTEIGGRIMAVNVDEGDEVEAGQVLVTIDPANLLAQQTQLEATLATARANLLAVIAPPRAENIAAAEAQLAQARAARDGAKTTWEAAQALVANPRELQTRITQAQARVTEAQKSLEIAQVALKRAEIQAEAASRNQSSHAALVQNDVAQQQLRAAQIGVQMNEVALAGSRQQVELLAQLRAHPLQLISQANAARAAYQQVEAAVQVAEANLTVTKAGPTQEDIAIAETQVAEAQAALAVVQVQLDKLILTAPRAALVNHRAVNPGELAAPGTALLELSDIETVELTVYIPETQIGQVKVGRPARVFVDAYPGEQFEGRVTFIAHEAEFTPRNVQTQEERVTLVFGVKITLDNPTFRLKPGMPADAEILPELEPGFVQAPTPTPQPQATATPAAAVTPTEPPDTVLPSSPEPTAVRPETSTPAATGVAKQVEVVAWGLKVREGPGINYPVVTFLAKGEWVTVLEVDTNTGWLRVQLPGGQGAGWISSKPEYVTVE